MHTTRTLGASAAAALGLAAAAAPAQDNLICWSWELVDTAGNVGFVGEGESALLTLWGSFDVPNHGFSQAGPYDITGDAEWAGGTVDAFTNLLFFSVGYGTLGTGNGITAIENFQLNELFNSDYKDANPIPLYSIEWTPDRYAGQFATITNGAPDAYIYTNELGSSVLYAGDPDCGPFTFQVLPAPGSLALLGLGALMTHHRRRDRAGDLVPA
jgi:hypothetical protein